MNYEKNLGIVKDKTDNDGDGESYSEKKSE